MINMKRTVGVFCYGSSCRTIYHNGFLNALKDNEIVVDQLIGVSGGFFSIFLHIAGVDNKSFLKYDKNSPLYKGFFKKNFYSKILDYYVPIVLNRSELSEKEIIEQMNLKCSAIASLFPNIIKNKIIKEFKTIEDIKDALKATAAIPWFTESPYKLKDEKCVDGAIFLGKKRNYLNTDIKIILLGLPEERDRILLDEMTFTFNNNYGNKLKTLFWGNPNDYVELWEHGYNTGLEFIKIYKNLII